MRNTQTLNHGEHYARYHGNKTQERASSRINVRHESTYDVNYARQYQMPLRNFRLGNNGRTDGGVR